MRCKLGRALFYPLRRVGVRVYHQERTVGVVPVLRRRVEHVQVPVAAAAAVDEEAETLLAGLPQPVADRLREVDLLPSGLGLVQRDGDGVRYRLAKFLEFNILVLIFDYCRVRLRYKMPYRRCQPGRPLSGDGVWLKKGIQ